MRPEIQRSRIRNKYKIKEEIPYIEIPLKEINNNELITIDKLRFDKIIIYNIINHTNFDNIFFIYSPNDYNNINKNDLLLIDRKIKDNSIYFTWNNIITKTKSNIIGNVVYNFSYSL